MLSQLQCRFRWSSTIIAASLRAPRARRFTFPKSLNNAFDNFRRVDGNCCFLPLVAAATFRHSVVPLHGRTEGRMLHRRRQQQQQQQRYSGPTLAIGLSPIWTTFATFLKQQVDFRHAEHLETSAWRTRSVARLAIRTGHPGLDPCSLLQPNK